MNDTVLPGAADRATALFTDWIEGRYDQVVAGFDATMTAQLPVDQLTAAWNQILGLVGSYQRMGEPLVRQLGGYTVVDIPLTFAAGQMKGRVAYNAEGQVSGLFIVTPETP
jgi:hypothetical protein